MPFKDGDLVRLKSGGPLMTVENHRKDDMIEVRWFDGASLSGDAFRSECLVLARNGADNDSPTNK